MLEKLSQDKSALPLNQTIQGNGNPPQKNENFKFHNLVLRNMSAPGVEKSKLLLDNENITTFSQKHHLFENELLALH